MGDISAANAPKRSLLDEQRQWLMDAVSSPNVAKVDFLRYAKIRAQSGLERAPFQDVWSREGAGKELAKVDSELAALTKQEADAKKLAAQEERRLANLKATQSRHDSNAQRYRGNAEAATGRAEDIDFRHSQEEAGRIERTPVIRRTEDMQMDREIKAAEEREKAKEERELRKRDRSEFRSGPSDSNTLGATGGDPALVGAVRELTGAATESNQEIVALLKTCTAALKAQNQDLGDLTQFTRNMRLS